MTPADILTQATAAGLTLWPEGADTMHVKGPADVRARWVPLLKAHKPEILRLLSTAPDWELAIRRWLAAIGEDDPEPVLERCRRDPEARAYFLSHARRWLRYQRVSEWLSRNGDLRLAVVVEDAGDKFIATVGVRGKGIVDLAIDRHRYDGIKLMELVERYGGAWPKMEAAA
ncbi:hypothetical protein [Pelomicrobium methylotrophicum]|uniref:Uncharacterized protein n=1 Tax=Pelomicrobium methylotrophicum TaxID=2602750 RepID=A0A5C7EPA2_9PROT|nr:hypothetical protein [Pelomicrobium methylotrophicum]TXF13705.1 hypothetical protein FR698_00935 [Pelomicrobium methylotrophicum]